MQTPDPPPLARFYNLSHLSEAGYETTIAASPEDRARIASWADVDSIERFEARISLKRLSNTRFLYRAELAADITQACVVTLDPVLSKISLDFTRTLQLVQKAREGFDLAGPLSPAEGDDDVPEEIESTRYDLAAPLLEEFSLAIDPYPHAPGVTFELPAEAPEQRDSPFARLKVLKGEG